MAVSSLTPCIFVVKKKKLILVKIMDKRCLDADFGGDIKYLARYFPDIPQN